MCLRVSPLPHPVNPPVKSTYQRECLLVRWAAERLLYGAAHYESLRVNLPFAAGLTLSVAEIWSIGSIMRVATLRMQ